MNEQVHALRGVEDEVRRKAVEVATWLAERGVHPRRAVSQSVALARDWLNGRFDRPAQATTRSTAPVLVEPHLGRWLVRRSDDTPPLVYPNHDDAVRRAVTLARRANVDCVVLGRDGELLDKFQGLTIDGTPLAPPPASESAEPVTLHVTKRGRAWSVARGDEQLEAFTRKRDAVRHARQLGRAATGPVEVVVRYANGKVQRRFDA